MTKILNFETGCDYTPDEVWMTEREPGHHYSQEADFAHEHLGKGPGRLLIVGSPIFEVKEFINDGWDVTYMDVRIPPILKAKIIHGDICTTELESESFDAVSSTCVLCHVGLGRYGDPLMEEGDEVALKNIWKALKHGALAAITFGVVAGIEGKVRIKTCHRIYNPDLVREMSENAGFEVVKMAFLHAERNPPKWIDRIPTIKEDNVLGRYVVSVLLKKC